MVVHKPFAEELKIDRVILARFMPGEDLFAGLERISKEHGIERGMIISAIGSLKNVFFVNVKTNIHLPVRSEDILEIEEAGPVELLSLEGNFFPSEKEGNPVFHLHAIIGSPSGSVMGGHLLKADVFTTTEIFIGKIVGSSVYKAKSDVTGRMELLKR
jgi:hypothetical protein